MSGVNEWLISLSEYIGGMSDELDNAKAENAKLRELVDYMTPIALYSASERERDELRKLGVEVEV